MMEKSASEPVLRNEDYAVPCHGVGATGHPKRVLLGKADKDTGEHSTRINMIIKQAGKTPGPGKYLAHVGWDRLGGNKFENTDRSCKQMNKVPAPHHYEAKDFADTHIIGARENLSHHPRSADLLGKQSKGKKRSFLDQAIRHGEKVPGPGHFDPKPYFKSGIETKITGTVSYSREVIRTSGRGTAAKEIGPTDYNLNFNQRDEIPPKYTVPKDPCNNFIDKAVRDTYVDRRAKKEMPGPGTYNLQDFDINRTSRGTMHSQLRGITRNTMHGYM
jgi:hypothetical protein